MLAHLLSALQAARPALPLMPRALVEATLLAGGSIGSSDVIAYRLGLRNRFELARMLKRAGLPPLHRLGEWAAIISWLEANQRDSVSLCSLAYRSGRHPAACYRLVKEVTGKGWREVRAKGLAWAERQFLREVRNHLTP